MLKMEIDKKHNTTIHSIDYFYNEISVFQYLNVVHIDDDKLILVDTSYVLQDVSWVFRNQRLPVFWSRILKVNSNNSVSRSVQVGLEGKHCPFVGNVVILSIKLVNQLDKWNQTYKYINQSILEKENWNIYYNTYKNLFDFLLP